MNQTESKNAMMKAMSQNGAQTGKSESNRMIVKSLEIKNIGMIEHEIIQLDKSLILFYGDIKQGKTTILNAVKFCYGGTVPAEFIRKGEKSGFVKITFNKGYITRKVSRDKKGVSKAKKIEFFDGAEILKKPSDAIKKLLNPFSLDQNFFINKKPAAKKEFLTDLFQIDTTSDDKKIDILFQEAKELRMKISMYGEAELIPVEKPDIDLLNESKESINVQNEILKNSYKSECKKIDDTNKIADEHNETIKKGKSLIDEKKEKIDYLNHEIIELENEVTEIETWLSENEEQQIAEHPQQPDYISTEKVDEDIRHSEADLIRYATYQDELKKIEKKTADEDSLKEKTDLQKELKKGKASRLKSISDSCGVPGLSFDELGDFVFDGTAHDMLSTSQEMTLSKHLESLYPEGIGIQLIDRGESLGESIYKYIDDARLKEKTILATIVGSKPANVPSDIGVFVVESGKIK